MSESYSLIGALKNIKNKGIAYALKKDLIETAKRNPDFTIIACIVNACVLGNKKDLGGFTINQRGNLEYSDRELYAGEWVKTEG